MFRSRRQAVYGLIFCLPIVAAQAADVAPEVPSTITTKSVQTKCTTLPSTNVVESDVRGAVGPKRIVVVTTAEIGSYDKTTCAELSRTDLKSFFNSVVTNPMPKGLGVRDTKILYDRTSQRFFIMAMATQTGTTNLYYLFASSNSNRGDKWTGYVGQFLFTSDANRYDFVGFGVTPRWLVLTLDETPIVGGASSTIIAAQQKYIGVQGQFNPDFVDRVSGVGELQPSVAVDNDPAFDTIYFLSAGRKSGNAITRVTWHYNFPHRDIATSTIPVDAWTAPPDAVQPNGQKIDTGDGRFSAPGMKMGDALWQVHTVNVNGEARWRLYKLSITATTPTFTFTPNTAAGVHHSFNASVATAKTTSGAPVFVSFSRTRPELSNGDVASLMSLGPNDATTGWVTRSIAVSKLQYVKAAGGTRCNKSSLKACHWSATSSTVIDPSSVTSAWGFNQLITGTTELDWTTYAGKVN